MHDFPQVRDVLSALVNPVSEPMRFDCKINGPDKLRRVKRLQDKVKRALMKRGFSDMTVLMPSNNKHGSAGSPLFRLGQDSEAV